MFNTSVYEYLNTLPMDVYKLKVLKRSDLFSNSKNRYRRTFVNGFSVSSP